MSTYDHRTPNAREELVAYVAYLVNDDDERPMAVKIEDRPAYDPLARALAADDDPLPDEVAGLLVLLVEELGVVRGGRVVGWTWATAAARVADYCRAAVADGGR